MTITEEDYEERKNILLHYLDKLMSRKKVKCKDIFKIYKRRIERDEGITENMLSHIAKFMRNEMKANEDKVWEFFSPFLEHSDYLTHYKEQT